MGVLEPRVSILLCSTELILHVHTQAACKGAFQCRWLPEPNFQHVVERILCWPHLHSVSLRAGVMKNCGKEFFQFNLVHNCDKESVQFNSVHNCDKESVQFNSVHNYDKESVQFNSVHNSVHNCDKESVQFNSVHNSDCPKTCMLIFTSKFVDAQLSSLCVDWTIEIRNSREICPVSRSTTRMSRTETLCVPPALLMTFVHHYSSTAKFSDIYFFQKSFWFQSFVNFIWTLFEIKPLKRSRGRFR